jgi:hypothetical protein
MNRSGSLPEPLPPLQQFAISSYLRPMDAFFA